MEAHASTRGPEGLAVGDPAICFGCGTPLVVEALPYQVRAMSRKELLELDPETRAMIERAQEEILLKKRV
jgi:hypothetical protein